MRRIDIGIDSRVRIKLASLNEVTAEAIRDQFTHENPHYGDKRHPDAQPRIRTWSHQSDHLTVPRGGLTRVTASLDGAEIPYRIEDARTWRHETPGTPDLVRPLWDHQVALVRAGIEGETGLLRAPTGSGKTTAGFGIASMLKRRTLVMVWTGNLQRQWRERAVEELGMDPARVGRIGGRGGKEFIGDLTIGMQQSIYQRFYRGDDELAESFDIVICDEVQRFAADTLVAAIDPFRSKYRIGISADETRADGMEFLIYDLFGDVLASVEQKALIDKGVIVDVEMAVVPTKFKAPWYRYRQDFNRLLEQMCGDEARNEIGIKLAARAVQDGEQVLMFTHRVEHARSLDARLNGMGIRSGTLLGGADNEVPFQRTKDGLKSGDFRAAVGTYQAIAQGLDLPGVARGICMTPIGNNRQQIGQVKGRICRSSDGKTFGRLAYLLDSAVYGQKPIRNFCEWGHNVKVWHDGQWINGEESISRLRG